jgi:hypothetical protein
MTDNATFVFLDSSFKVPQSVQLKIIQSYASDKELAITFYGSELVGHEIRHDILQDYASQRRCSNFIFYSLTQFLGDHGLDLIIIRKLMAWKINLHFASQGLSNPSDHLLSDLYILSLSLPQFNDFKYMS